MSCECEGCGSLNLPQGPQGEQGEPGVNGTNGTNGSDGDDGISIAYIVTTLDPGDINCPCGGYQVQLGPDADGDGIPDPITNTLFLCTGCDATAPFDGVGGGIIMYDGNTADAALFVQIGVTTGLGLGVMDGYAVCNGNNNTPDLRGRFIISEGQNQDVTSNTLGLTYMSNGLGPAIPGQGIDEHILAANELASHTHTSGTLTTDTDIHDHDYTALFPVAVGTGTWGDNSNDESVLTSTTTQYSHNHAVNSGSTAANTPNGQAHENRPPYYILSFIKRIS